VVQRGTLIISMRKMGQTKMRLIEKLCAGLLLVVFGGIVLQGPISVGFGTLFPHYSLLIKAWKEILILLAAILLAIIMVEKKQMRLLKDPLVLLAVAYVVLHLIVVITPMTNVNINQVIAGLMIDLRYIAYFVVVYLFLHIYPAYRKNFLTVFIFGGCVVVGFAILQVFILPHDILKYIGYTKDTTAPFLTVDQNPSYIRINSTLRGPNPLGAYALIILTFIAAMCMKRKLPPTRQFKMIAVILIVGGIVALWASYSRSALIGAVIALTIAVIGTARAQVPRKVWIGLGVGIVVIIGGLAATWNTPFVSQVILHENPTRYNLVNSNEGHAASLQQGVARMAAQPLGAGIGTTGTPSLYGSRPLIIENHYLYVAHEVGWLGLVLYMLLFIMIIVKVWRVRVSYVALAVCAGGVGLAVIGLLLPVWADDTVAIIWWGLAAVAMSPSGSSASTGLVKRKEYHGRTIDKKTKRVA
jgi:hypothetical protein